VFTDDALGQRVEPVNEREIAGSVIDSGPFDFNILDGRLPNDVRNIYTIENMRRRFVKRLPPESHLPYSERLAFVGLESVEYRRLTTDIVMTYKIDHNLVDVYRNTLITVNSSYVARNYLLKIYKPTCISSFRSRFISMRCINVWNCQERQYLLHMSLLKKCLVTSQFKRMLSIFRIVLLLSSQFFRSL